jgi:hypothetical protein
MRKINEAEVAIEVKLIDENKVKKNEEYIETL